MDEFAGIPSRGGRSRALALAAAALAVFLAFKERRDLAYALSPAAPAALGDARAWAGRPIDALPLNRHVRLFGLPDRESAVVLDTSGAWTFSQFFRVLGTENRVFVRRTPDPLPAERARSDEFTGRLVRLDALPFSESIRQHFARHVTSTRFFRATDVAAALAKRPPGGRLVLADTTGESVTVAPEDEVVIDVARPGELRIDVPNDRFPSAEKVAERLRALGAVVVSGTDGKEEGGRHQVLVRVTDAAAREALFAGLDEIDRRVRVRPARASHALKAAALQATQAGLALGAGAVAPFDQVAAVRLTAPVTIPKDAVLLVEGERPRGELHTIAVVAILSLFAAVNLLALRRSA